MVKILIIETIHHGNGLEISVLAQEDSEYGIDLTIIVKKNKIELINLSKTGLIDFMHEEDFNNLFK